jgi:hypothetical protein
MESLQGSRYPLGPSCKGNRDRTPLKESMVIETRYPQQLSKDPARPLQFEPLDLSNKARLTVRKPETSPPKTSSRYCLGTLDQSSIVLEWSGLFLSWVFRLPRV